VASICFKRIAQQAGVPWNEIEMVLGHAIPSTIWRYVHYASEFLSKAVAVIDEYLARTARARSRRECEPAVSRSPH
jgi:hypothetical protein